MTYQVTVRVTVEDWSDVRAAVGNAVEAALSTVTEHQREDAYAMDVPALNRAMTDPRTQEKVNGSGQYLAGFGSAPVSITISREE